MTTASPDATFQVGTTYTARSAGDHTMTFSWTVVARTAKFITVVEHDDAKPKRVGIRTNGDGTEWALPDGAYSMAPVIRSTESTSTERGQS